VNFSIWQTLEAGAVNAQSAEGNQVQANLGATLEPKPAWTISSGMKRLALIARLVQFRNELVLLFRAFLEPTTPLWLKGAMLGVVAYVVSPIDLVPEFIPFLGVVDDLVLIPLAVEWLARRLPGHEKARRQSPRKGTTIDGTFRRM
jgi:uncharacterized membrane protein YkvA (DUF1232 family)